MKHFLVDVAKEVSKRMKERQVKGSCLSLKVAAPFQLEMVGEIDKAFLSDKTEEGRLR